MKALIFTGGEFLPPDTFDYRVFDLIICADKGFESAKKAGVVPDAAVGDFDSVQTAAFDIPIIKYPAEKDVTDTEIAVEYAFEKGAQEIVILGGTGGRLDHTFANLLLLHRSMKKGIDVKLYDGKNFCFVTDKSVNIKRNDKKYLSVFPLFGALEGLNLKGTKYLLENFHLPENSSLCVSNEILDEDAEVFFEKGVALIIMSDDR